MLWFWISIVIAAIAAYGVQKQSNECTVDEHRYKLYRLRDELRESAIAGDVSPSNWVFQYLDSSTAKTIAMLPEINLWSGCLIAIWRRHDDRVARAHKHLNRELSKPSNKKLAAYHDKYVEVCFSFLFQRHSGVRFFLCRLAEAIVVGQWVQRKTRRMVQLMTEAPETSTLTTFA
jgi:hypothetical protein